VLENVEDVGREPRYSYSEVAKVGVDVGLVANHVPGKEGGVVVVFGGFSSNVNK
jgi:hypothetical protein